MRTARKTNDMPQELVLAIGLVWGHLNVGQFEQAYDLARGCLRVWPADKRLNAMAAFAAIELGETMDEQKRSRLIDADCKEWIDVVLLRAGYQDRSDTAAH